MTLFDFVSDIDWVFISYLKFFGRRIVILTYYNYMFQGGGFLHDQDAKFYLLLKLSSDLTIF